MHLLLIICHLVIVTAYPTDKATSSHGESISIKRLEKSEAFKDLSFVDLVARRPSRDRQGLQCFQEEFAAHKDVRNLDIDATTPVDKIATATWNLRLNANQDKGDKKWGHRFTCALRDYLASIGFDGSIICAIHGYHMLKLKNRAEELAKIRSVEEINAVVEKIYSQFVQRPSPLQIEESLRDTRWYYHSAKQAVYALRVFMRGKGYSNEEIRLAGGSRKRFLINLASAKVKKVNALRKVTDRKKTIEENVHSSVSKHDKVFQDEMPEHDTDSHLGDLNTNQDALECSEWWEDLYNEP